MALLHRASGIRGSLKKFTGELVVVKDRKGGEHTFRNVPDLRDIETTAALLRHLGMEVDVTPPIVKVRTGWVLLA